MRSRETAKPEWQHVHEYFGASNNFQYVIPVYQRDYVWEADKQVTRLLEDFSKLLGNEDEHFIGIVINYKVYLGRGHAEQFFVIDGQQRLTTLFLLIYSIYQRAIQEKDDYFVDLLEDCLFVNPKRGRDSGYKLVPLMNKTNVFTKILDNESISEEEKCNRVYEAYEFIKDYVEKDLCDYSIEDLVNALERLILVDIPLDKEDNAQQIFESINALGSPLEASDLIRNFVLMRCPDSDKKEFYNSQWLIFENKFVDEDELENFFRYFIEAKNETFVNTKNVYNDFREWFIKQNEKYAVNELTTLLSQYADYYNYIYHTELKMFEKKGLWKTIVDFRNIKSTMPTPFILEITKLYKENKIDIDQYKSIIEIVNSFIVRRAIIGLDTSGISKYFCTLLKNVLMLCEEDYSNIVDATKYCVIDINKEKGSRFPTDEEIKSLLKTQDVYQYPDALHYFFDKYENEGQDVDTYHPTLRCQIEHIMPQDESKWIKGLDIDLQTYDSYKNRLGNLTLTTKHDNPKMSNNLFEYKTIILKGTAQYLLNVDVYAESTWGTNQIDKRTEQLICELLRLYPYAQSQNTAKYDEIRYKNKQYDKRAIIRTRDTFATKLWQKVNDSIEDDDPFEPKDYGSRGAYDFTFGRAYHLYIDLWEFDQNRIAIGIWFSNSKNNNFNIFREHIDELDNQEYKYESVSDDGKRRGRITTYLEFENYKTVDLDELVNKLMSEIRRLYKITDALYVDLKEQIEEVEFYSNLTDKIYITSKDDEGSPCIKDKITGEIPYRVYPSQKDILGDYLQEVGVEPLSNTRARIKQIIDYQKGYLKTKDWIIPCDPLKYDAGGAFAKHGVIEWKQNTPNIEVGSNVYIYVSRPVMAIKYKAVVEEINITEPTIDDSEFEIKGGLRKTQYYMRIRLLESYDDKKYAYEEMKKNGFGSPQGWCKVSLKFEKYLNSK